MTTAFARRALLVMLAVLVPSRGFAELTDAERRLLESLDVTRTQATTRRFAEGIVKTRSGAGAGTAVAGSVEEKQLAAAIEQEFRRLGLKVHQETFPVRHYQFAEVSLTAGGRAVAAVSLHAAGGTWGTQDGVPYHRGNASGGRVVRAPLVDAGRGHLPDYDRIGDVRGKVVLVQRVGWPTYEILEAAHRGAAALLLYDYPGSREDTLKQDSMWYHEQLPTASISRGEAVRLQQELTRGAVEIALENRIDVADGRSQNVIATIAGKEFPDEWILVSAHYDRWFEAAQDNSVGVAVMLELARVFASYTPRRSIMFVGIGAEEAGIEATESDWLAGSHAFVRAHPEITRRLAYAFNVDRAGWTAPNGVVYATTDTLPFQRQLIADLGLADRVTVRGAISSNVDAWNYGPVGGGAVGYLNWDSDVIGGRGTYSQYYHTQLDVFRPEDYTNLIHDLKLGALSVYRMDQAGALPISFTETAAWVREALESDASTIPDVSFEAARAALRAFEAQAVRVDAARASLRGEDAARMVNRWLMRVRKDLVPWLLARGRAGFRTAPHASAVRSLAQARAAAERGDAANVLQLLEKMPDVANAARVSQEVFEAQRLYWYTSGDWSVEYEHKPRPIRTALVEIYRRLKAGGAVSAEVVHLRQLEAESLGRLSEALFIVTGKLHAAATALERTPMTPPSVSANR